MEDKTASAKDKYGDIINLPHHVSETRTPMPISARAAQFSPFAALSGYDDKVRESARLTQERIELAEDARQALDEALRRAVSGGGEVTVTYFVPDERKSGGRYATAAGQVKRMDPARGLLILSGGERIDMGEIVGLDFTDAPEPDSSIE